VLKTTVITTIMTNKHCERHDAQANADSIVIKAIIGITYPMEITVIKTGTGTIWPGTIGPHTIQL
jgi:hypothetical protein